MKPLTRTRKRLPILFGVGIFVLQGFLAHPGFTQAIPGIPAPAPAGEKTAAPAAEEPKAPATIAIDDISRRAEEVHDLLGQYRLKDIPDSRLAGLRLRLLKIRNRVERFENAADAAVSGRVSLGELGSLLNECERWSAKIAADEEFVAKGTHKLKGEIQSLEELERRWIATREKISGESPPNAVKDRVQTVLDEARKAREVRKKKLDLLLDFQDELSSDKLRLGAVAEKLQEARTDAVGLMMSFNAPPVWSIFPAAEGSGEMAGRTPSLGVWQMTRQVILDFAEVYRTRFPLHVVIFAFVLGIAVHRKRRIRRSGGELESEDLLAARPFLSALFVALMAVPWIYPKASYIIHELALLFLGPVILGMLVGDTMPPGAKRRIIGVVGLFLFYELQIFWYGSAWVDRILLLLVDGTALAVFLRLVLHPPLDPGVGRPSFWCRIRVLGAWIGVGLLSVALVGAIVGMTMLGWFLTRLVITSAYYAAVLHVGVHVLEGVAATIFSRRFGRVAFGGESAIRRVRPWISWLLRLGAVYIFVLFVLNDLDLVADSRQMVRTVLGYQLHIGAIEISLQVVILFGGLIWLSMAVGRAVSASLENVVLRRMGLPRGVPESIANLVRYAIIVVGVLIAAAVAGIELTRLALVVSALSVGIGFGLREMVGNFVSGLILLFERPVRVGDTIEIENLRGTVRMIGIRTSTVRTFDGAEVIVPNGRLTQENVINWTLSDQRRRVEIPVGVEYGTDPTVVIETLTAVARQHPEVLDDPEPVTLFTAFGESSLDFVLQFWTGSAERWRVLRSDIAVGIEAALREKGIGIPFPQVDVHMKRNGSGDSSSCADCHDPSSAGDGDAQSSAGVP